MLFSHALTSLFIMLKPSPSFSTPSIIATSTFNLSTFLNAVNMFFAISLKSSFFPIFIYLLFLNVFSSSLNPIMHSFGYSFSIFFIFTYI